jgi:hypothetical protein
MDENLTSRTNYRISVMSSPVCRVIAIRDRIRKFHTDSTQTVGRDHALCVAPTTPKTNKRHEIKEKRSLGGHSLPPDHLFDYE